MRRIGLLLFLPLLLGAGAPEPDGFRMGDYQAPVPETIAGGQAVGAEALRNAIDAGAIVIDVLPAPRRPPAQPAGQPWLPVPRKDIQGSLWWPEVGRGALSPAMDDWFQRRLAEVTNGDRDKPIAFYCKVSCWMSWNAAKRAIAYGYRRVLWFGEGTETWSALGYPTQTGIPEPVPAD
jgi:PQQ-dependent catabolism-associated CXXCW motif protein